MNNPLPLMGYDPKCKLYKREQTKGKVMWYVSYYLPNNKRVQRPVHRNQRQANKFLRVKELQLIQGNFDSKDLKKMKGLFPDTREKERLTIDQAINLYLSVTEARKTASTRQSEKYAINNYFSVLADSQKEFIDEITPLDVQMLVRFLNRNGKSEATIKTAIAIVRKVYNCLIDEIKVCSCQNPVPPKIKLPKKNGLVRNRLATDEEIRAILQAKKPSVTHSSSWSPIDKIVPFIIFTGARLSEVLHAEWSDFDLKNGVWNIKRKPKCPTKYELGWSPKWGKERTVILFQEALDILNSIPRVKTVGKIQLRDANGEISGHEVYPADFIFPKEEIKVLPDGNKIISYSRIDSLKRSWKSLKDRAKVSDLQIKDLRTYFNHVLKSRFGFSSKEAGVYIGNSEEVNDLHYTPVTNEQIRAKMNLFSLGKAIYSK